ncbi:DUF4142 domain-containing protein [bacterium]|nr:MAG: DUF4142 domain-containing protein [bacterium]
MTDIENTNESEELIHTADGRRAFLTRMAVAGFGVAALGLVPSMKAEAATQPKQPEADSGHDYPMPRPTAGTEAQFRKGVIGPATLSLLTSEIAVDKATNAQVLEFANFELREAIGVTTVLKSMKTPVPPMDAVARATLQKIKSTPKGAAFDKAYITAQLANHEFLRDLAEIYLKNSAGHTSMAEMHGRHLAILTLGAFKEHVVHTKNILRMMGA